MNATSELKLYNTLTREKSVFAPIDPDNVRMYVCGPTVYDFAHIGNARPVIVFDVLFRLLRHAYGEDHVIYARNITDVDDKINARALRDHPGLPLNEAIRVVTEKTATRFLDDSRALGCLEPTVQPRATDNIPQMIAIIQTLIAKGHAYAAEGEVLFDTKSMADYGQLSKRNLDEQQAGARIVVDAHKKNPGDFVLWKLSDADEPGWESPWGRGRPGWHIECSAMSGRYLGEIFDIHGGGLDLIFPHHENEIAQSRCAHGTDVMANVWMHNGFLQVEGRKMSKSEGNFVTIYDLLHTEAFGGRQWSGRVLRLAMLMTHYRVPIDWTSSNLLLAAARLADYAQILDPHNFEDEDAVTYAWNATPSPSPDLIVALSNDLNTPEALSELEHLAARASKGDDWQRIKLAHGVRFLGLLEKDSLKAHQAVQATFWSGHIPEHKLDAASALSWRLKTAVANNSVVAVSTITSQLADLGFERQSDEFGSVDLDYVGEQDRWIDDAIAKRLEYLKVKNFPEADRIRDELSKKGIQLKDGKDPVTGDRVTAWELKK